MATHSAYIITSNFTTLNHPPGVPAPTTLFIFNNDGGDRVDRMGNIGNLAYVYGTGATYSTSTGITGLYFNNSKYRTPVAAAIQTTGAITVEMIWKFYSGEYSLTCMEASDASNCNCLWSFSGGGPTTIFTEYGSGTNVNINLVGYEMKTYELQYSVMTREADGVTWKLYQNGYPTGAGVAAHAPDGGSLARLYIGDTGDGGYYGQFILCGVRITVGTVYTAEQVLASSLTIGERRSRNALPITSDCVAMWGMNGASATDNETDLTGNGHTATQTSSPIPTDGIVGSAARRIDSGDYFTVVDVPALRLQTLTVCQWLFFNGSKFDNYQKAIHYDHQTYDDVYVIQFILTGDYKLYSGLQFTDGSRASRTASTNLTYGWHFVGFTWDGTTFSFYIDGALIGSQEHAGKTIRYGNDYLTIGNDRDAPNNQWWPGTIDQTAIYNVAKPLEWFEEIYTHGGAVTPQGYPCSFVGGDFTINRYDCVTKQSPTSTNRPPWSLTNRSNLLNARLGINGKSSRGNK
jgi:hypothetical protein